MSYELKHSYCPMCGYDLSGLDRDELGEVLCPECGRRVSHQDATRVPIYLSDPVLTSTIIALIPSILIAIGLGNARSGITLNNSIITGVFSFFVALIGTAMISSNYKRWKGPKPKWSRHRLCSRVFIQALLAMFVLTMLIWMLINAKINGSILG